jgi:hypothetical protein
VCRSGREIGRLPRPGDRSGLWWTCGRPLHVGDRSGELLPGSRRGRHGLCSARRLVRRPPRGVAWRGCQSDDRPGRAVRDQGAGIRGDLGSRSVGRRQRDLACRGDPGHDPVAGPSTRARASQRGLQGAHRPRHRRRPNRGRGLSISHPEGPIDGSRGSGRALHADRRSLTREGCSHRRGWGIRQGCPCRDRRRPGMAHPGHRFVGDERGNDHLGVRSHPQKRCSRRARSSQRGGGRGDRAGYPFGRSGGSRQGPGPCGSVGEDHRSETQRDPLGGWRSGESVGLDLGAGGTGMGNELA